MNTSRKSVLLIALLVVVLIGATILYQRFGSGYIPPTTTPTTEESVDTVPNFTVTDANGNAVSLSDYFGKPIVLNFWATWCGYCQLEMPDFHEAYLAYPDVQFLMVNATDGVRETVDVANEYITEKGYTFPVVYDTNGEAVSAYLVRSYPTTYFIDADGHLSSYQSGRMTRDMIDEHIQTMLAEK